MRIQGEIVFRFLDEDVAAPARLLLEQAPETCSAVWDALPASGLARHGIYSGSEVYLILPALITARREHATTIVGAGDVGFLTVDKESGYGIEEAYSEVCWFYDLDATPSMPEGPIAVNVPRVATTSRCWRSVTRPSSPRRPLSAPRSPRAGLSYPHTAPCLSEWSTSVHSLMR